MAPNITREHVKVKMDRGDDFVLVEALSPKHYASSHLPGAINLPSSSWATRRRCCLPDKNVEIVVYCMSPGSLASREDAREFQEMASERVLHYAVGKQDWIRAGLPAEARR